MKFKQGEVNRFNYRRIIKTGHRVAKKCVDGKTNDLKLRLLKLGETFRIFYLKSERVRRAHTISNSKDDL